MGYPDGLAHQFEAGARLPADLAQDASSSGATLGWIVLVCMALMVVGLVTSLVRSFSAAGRERLKEQGAAGPAGAWLVFMSVILLVIGTASLIAERNEPGAATGGPLAALGLVGTGALLFVAGAWATAAARRRAHIYRYGLPGEAVVRDIRRTRTAVNRHSVFEFDLEVSGASFPTFRVTHRDVIPMWVSGRVEQGTTVPVKVHPSTPTRLVFDWDLFDDTEQRGVLRP